MSATATASPKTHARHSAAPRAPFQRFLDEHREAVLGFLRAMVGPDDADDCFQETFIAALRAYDRMDGRHPRAWVMTIARRKAIDHHRARARRPDPRSDLREQAAPPPGGGAACSGRSERGSGRRARARWWSIALRRAIVITQARGWRPSIRS